MISEDDLHRFFDILPVGLWRQGENKKFAWANRAFSQITGYSWDDLRSMETIEIIKPSWRQYVLDRNRAMLNGELDTPYYFPTRTKQNDDLIVMGVIGRIGAHYYGGYIEPIYIDQDKDALSGLFNEIYFFRTLRRYTQECYTQKRAPFTLMMIGIDQFKKHRSGLGLGGTDALIRLISDKILELSAEGNIAARIADGQFAILFPASISTAHEKMAKSLIDFAGRESLANLGHEVSLSIAVIEYHENIHGDLERKLISHAHRAMFRIQAQGGNAVIIRPDL